jgi:hypothetical protein
MTLNINLQIDIANLIDFMIPDDAFMRSDDDDFESTCLELAAHYLTNIESMPHPLDLELIESMLADLTR